MEKLKIVLASTNLAKTKALETVLKDLKLDLEIVNIDVDSGVSTTPTNDDEGIQGCLNRIENAKVKVPKAKYYVGMEGIITRSEFGTFICGWVCILDSKTKRFAKGCSAKVEIPEFIAKEIKSFGELSGLVKEKYPSDLIIQMDKLGTNGVVTNGLYNRVDEFVDGLNCAFGYLQNETNFDK